MPFSKNKDDFFKNVDKLPDVLIDIIYDYIPKCVTMFLTKKNYKEEHYLLRKFINKRKVEQYIRRMVRQDNDFVFKQLLVENNYKWLNMRKYYYKECIYGNYLNFLESYAIDNKSEKCRKIILDFFEEQGLSKNQHKKKTNRYIRWNS
jgi:hypothetical protein